MAGLRGAQGAAAEREGAPAAGADRRDQASRLGEALQRHRLRGRGNTPEEFAQRAGIKWTCIPDKDGSQALTDMVGGQAQVMFNGMLATYQFVRDAKLKALAISSAKRFPSAPDVVRKLHGTVTSILTTPQMMERLDAGPRS